MTNYPVLVEVIKDVVSNMRVPIVGTSPMEYHNINYQPGLTNQIVEALLANDNSISLKELKYPLIAVVLPVKEKRGGPNYSEAKLPRVVFANLTETNTESEKVLDKYSSTGVFKTILIPMYREFFIQLAKHPLTNIGEWESIKHYYSEWPFQLPVSQGVTDYVDSIEVLDLEINLNKQINC